MQNKEYWAERFRQLEASQHRTSQELVEKVQQEMRRAEAEIERKIEAWYGRLAANNGISMVEARKLLNARELAEFHWDVETYIKYGEENAINGQWMKQLENASARVHISRLEQLKLQVQQEAEKLYGNYLDSVDSHVKSLYEQGFYRTAFEIQKGIGVGWNLTGVDSNRLDKLVRKPWAADGKNFSERIWSSKQQLIENVHTSLTQMCVLGQAPGRTIDTLAKAMNTSKCQAGRLIMTESAFFGSESRKDCFNELGVEKYKIVATLDSHTSDICQEMDGKVFPLSEYASGATAPPFHVWCRSTTVPDFGDEFDKTGKRAARGEDGKTSYVPADMTYQKWKEKYVVEDGGKSELQRTKKDVKLTPEEEIKNAEQKLKVLQAEYDKLAEINTKFYMSKSDFSTPEDRQAWCEWKKDFLQHDDIVRVQQRMIELAPELSDAKAGLATARVRLLKEGNIDFTPVNTIKEANEYAKKLLGINAEYRGVDIRAVNEWNQGLANMKQVFPDLVNDKFRFVGESHERNALAREVEFKRQLKWIKEHNTCGWSDEQCVQWANKQATSFVRKYLAIGKNEMASSWSPGPPFDVCRGICLNKGYFGDYDKALQSGIRQVEMQWHPAGCSTIKATFDHEFGHQLDDWLKVSKQKNIQDLFDSRTVSELTNDLSEYAWNNQNKNRYSEMIAEAWSEYCNNPAPRPIAVEVGETIERLYVEWARKNL